MTIARANKTNASMTEQNQENRKLISLGFFLGSEVTGKIESVEKPKNDRVIWTDTSQMHLAWQTFFRTKETYNLSAFHSSIEKIEQEFFPMMINLFAVRIMPNIVSPSSLMWQGEILEIRGNRLNLDPSIKKFSDVVKKALGEVCVVSPTMQLTPNIVLARFTKDTKGADLKSLEKYDIDSLRIKLVGLEIIEAVKEPGSISYKKLES
jgi:hypothetical protein